MTHLLPRLAFLPMLLFVLGVMAERTPVATAQSMAEQLATARRLEFGGEWEEAERFYQGVVQAGGEHGQAARLDLARLYERWERYTPALETLRPVLEGQAPARAWLQQGSVLQALGRADDANAAYGRYIAANGPAAAYARVESAKMQAARDDAAGALAMLSPLLDGRGPDNARRAAMRVAGSAAEAVGDDRSAEALTYYRGHAALATAAAERVPSLWKVAEISRRRDDQAGAVAAYRELVTGYPGSSEAEQALEALASLGRPAATLEAALVHYRRSNNETARRLYNSVLNSGGTAAERAVALYYLGALAERRADAALALENYGESYRADPSGRLADEALWARAVLLEESGDASGAQAEYALIVSRDGDSPRAAEAAFRNGSISYEAGQIVEARRRWSAAATARRGDVAATASLWAGRAAGELGDQAAARAAYAEAVRRAPNSYYGLRAAALLAGAAQAPSNGSATLRLPTSDWSGAEAWLAGWAGPEDGAAWAALQASDDWRATWELVEAGWNKPALEAFLLLLSRRTDAPWLQYRAARALTEGGFPRAAFTAGFNIVQKAPSGSPVPPAIQRLRFPAPWADLVQRYADRRGIDPLLLYAMMRQESAFDPQAGSSAGAFGLTQFVAGTAMDVARALGKDVRLSDLARPALAVEFGAFYLAAQIRAADGNIYRGLAAYNGGGTNATRWTRAAGSAGDIDRFVEAIDFRETEAYLHLILENYAWYRFLYGAADQPSIIR